VHRGRGVRGPPEPFDDLRVTGQVGPEHLDGDGPSELEVLREVDARRGGRGELATQLVAAGERRLRGLSHGADGSPAKLGSARPRALRALRARSAWRDLCAGLHAVGAAPRVYGSYGWQLLTGLDHVRAGSDIDLWLPVADAEHADAVAGRLQRFEADGPRLDGELVFGDGAAVAWREWLAWRVGRVNGLLVKTLDGCSLVHSRAWQATTMAEAA